MSKKPIFLSVKAKKDVVNKMGWQGTFHSRNSQEFDTVTLYHPFGHYVVLPQFVAFAASYLTGRYPGRTFVIEKCEVENTSDEQHGQLPMLLSNEIKALSEAQAKLNVKT